MPTYDDERKTYITLFTKQEVEHLLRLVQGEPVPAKMRESLGHKIRGWMGTNTATIINLRKMD